MQRGVTSDPPLTITAQALAGRRGMGGSESGDESNGQNAGVLQAAGEMPIKTCPQCSVEFRASHSHNVFCTRACAVLGRSGPMRARVDSVVPCSHCGARFHKKPSHVPKSRDHFCNQRCRTAWLTTHLFGGSNANFRNAGWRVCVGCGKDYHSYSSGRRYCGQRCSQSLSSSEAMANLRRGADAERMCVAELESQGYVAVRSAASKGPYDVIGLRADSILLVQVKRTKANARRAMPSNVRAVMDSVFPISPIVRRQLWCWVDRKGWHVTDCPQPTEDAMGVPL